MINVKALLPQALIGLSFTLSACADLVDEAPVGESASQLSVSSWNPINLPSTPSETWLGAQAGTLNGVTSIVSTGDCGLWDCFPYQDTNHLHAGSEAISGQLSNSRVSLAPFNGFLYMAHSGTDGATTWVSRYSPATGQWSANFQVPYTSFAGPPAIVAYNNLLYFIGTGPYPYPMWYATMTTGEAFSSPVAIPGHDSASRPSAAVLFGKLYFAHRWGSTGDLVYGVYNGTTWAPAAHIPGGNAGGTLRGLEPAIAADNGVLHLVHQRPEGTPLVWWTYFNGCDWASAEVSLGTLQSNHSPSLTQGGPGLVMLTTTPNTGLFGAESYGVIKTAYTHPYSPYPPLLPNCDIGVIRF